MDAASRIHIIRCASRHNPKCINKKNSHYSPYGEEHDERDNPPNDELLSFFTFNGIVRITDKFYDAPEKEHDGSDPEKLSGLHQNIVDKHLEVKDVRDLRENKGCSAKKRRNTELFVYCSHENKK